MAWIIIFLIVFLLFITIPGFKSFRDKYKDIFSFLIALVATFMGVYLSISLNKSLQDDKEKKEIISILELAKKEIVSEDGIGNTSISRYPGTAKGIVVKKSKTYIPIYFQSIISNNKYMSSLTTKGSYELYRLNKLFLKLKELVDSYLVVNETDYELYKSIVKCYADINRCIIDLLQLEIDVKNGIISELELSYFFDKKFNELLSTQIEKNKELERYIKNDLSKAYEQIPNYINKNLNVNRYLDSVNSKFNKNNQLIRDLLKL